MSKSWRRDSTGPAPKQGGRYWQEQQKPTSAEDAAKRRRWKLAGLLLAFFGLLSLLVGRLLFLPKDLVVLPIIVQYAATVDLDSGAYPEESGARGVGASPIPVNGLASEDTRTLKSSLLTNFQVKATMDANVDRFSTAEDFLREFTAQLSDLRAEGPHVFHKTIVIYLSAHGVVDKDETPCLLMANSDPQNCKHWLKVESLVKAIQDSPNLKGTNVVLLLDSSRIRDCWPMGVFDNDFAERLRVTIENTANDHLFVVNSASSGQQAWTSPELNGTVFGYFVAKGLAGEANKSGKTVTLQELVEYLRTNVGKFARQFRNSTQQPFLVTGKNAPADVELAYAISKSQVEVPEPDIRVEQQRSDAVSRLWDRFEQVHADAAYRFQPLRFSKVADRLIRLEDLVIAGESYASQFDSVLQDTSDELEELARARDSYTEFVITAAAMARLKQYQDRAVPQEEFLTWLKDRKDPEKKPKNPVHSRDECALVVWDWLANLNQITAEEIDTAESYLELAAEKTPRLLSELRYVRLVDAYLPWSYRSDWGDLLGRDFAVLRTTEELAAPEDIRSFYWVRERLEEIDQDLRAARDQLFVGSDEAVERASQIWNVVAPVQGEGGGLAEVELSEQTVTRAYRTRDASLALTPYFGRWAASYDRDRLPTVARLIEGTRRLCEQLDRQATEIDVTALVDTQSALKEMQRLYEAKCKDCLDAGDRDVSQETLRDITELLSVPIPTPGASYHNKLRQILMTHRWAVPGDIYATPQTAAVSETPPTPPLQVSDHPAAKMLPVGDDARSLAALGGYVRSHLANVATTAKGLALQTDALMASGRELAIPRAARKQLSEADQQYRWAAPFLPAYTMENNYVAQLWQYDYHFFLLWQGERALRDLWGPNPGTESDASFFFAEAVRDSVREAKRLYFAASQHRQQLTTAANDAAKAIQEWEPLRYDDIKLFDDPTAAGGLVDHALEFQPLAAGRVALKSELQLDKSVPAIFIENSGRPFPWYNRDFTGGVKIPFGRRSPVDFQLRHAFDRVALSGEPDLMAITFFRGHLKSDPIAVETGIEAIVFHRPAPDLTSVVVTGDRGTKTQIMFVLDYSASMGPRKAEGRKDKMAPAKNAFVEILNKIKADEKKFDVGFCAFGHRYRDEYQNKPDLRDVEELVKLGPAEDNIVAIRNELSDTKKLKPFGYTPLYQSISDASDAMTRFRRPGKKLLVVITDGENYVQGGDDAIASQLAAAAVAAVDGGKIQLEVVGFGVGGDGLRQGPTIMDFAKRSPRITFLNANKIEDVKQRIIDAIGLKTYAVTGPSSPPNALNLGKSWNSKSTSLGDFTVAVSNGPSEAITLLGGEAIEMTYEVNSSLLHNTYRDEDPQKRADGHIVRFHTNGYDGTEFGISLQKEDRRFTARPRRAFMTIKPAGEEDVVFHGHEMEFELRRPVPVMHYQMIGWPKDQARAIIELSYSMSEPIGVATVPLNLADNTLKQPFKNVTLKLSTTPSQNNDAVRVIIDEVHDADSKLFPLHLVFQPEPLTARHSLARRSRDGGYEVTHVFSIEPERLRNTEVSLQLTTPNERRDKWVRVVPVTVDVHHWTTRK